ncbi:MAG: GTP-binding protein [Candidatus Thorarchaeota archaeon]|nr:GTP-binding protein [Candidatus Thorarchaeota archaeon]
MNLENTASGMGTTGELEPFEGYTFRVVMLGEAGVGKTSLVKRYIEGAFEEEYKQTLNATHATKNVEVAASGGNRRPVRLVCCDMGGQDTYRELRRQYMKGASAAIIVYDVTRPETFMATNNWYEAFREVCPDAAVFICANRVDLVGKRVVPVEPGHMLRDWLQADYFETSAKTGSNVVGLFERVAATLLDRALAQQVCMKT